MDKQERERDTKTTIFTLDIWNMKHVAYIFYPE